MGLGLSTCVFERSMSVRERFAKRAGSVAERNRATLLDDTAVALPSPAYEGMVSRARARGAGKFRLFVGWSATECRPVLLAR
jgi:hypothetical protein